MTDLRVDKSMMPRRSFGARLLSMVLVFSYIITFVVLGNAVLGLTAYADDNENSDFNIYVYMADYLLAQDKPSGKSFSFYMNEVKPMAEIWTESMTPEFEASVLAWETTNLILDPADSASKALDAKGYYMTVIMSMLEASYSCDSTIKKLNNSMVKDASKIYKEFCSCFKEISNSELKDFLSKGSFTDDERALVNAAQERYLENNKFLGANQAAKDIILALDASKKPQEYVEKFIEYCNLYQISDEWKQCLSDMNEKCDRSNKPLAAALETLVVVSSDLNNSIYQLWKDGINEAGAQFFKYGVKELLKVMLDNCPLIKGIDLGKAIGTTISNMLFSTDKTIEEYYVISAYCDVFNLYKSTLRDVINEYRNDRTPENAQKFISYFDMFFTVYESGNKFGQDFTDVLFTEGIVSKIMRSEEQYQQITKNTEDMTRYAEQAKKNLSQNWITDLAKDHSDIYEALVSLVELDGQYISVTRVAFERESVEWGLNDVVFNGYECAAYPEEADCRDIVYSSSDENVALIDNNGIVHVNGIGSCEITAISVDNEDATDTLSVTVIEEGGADSVRVIDIVPIKPQVGYTYTENGDGTLTITGYTGRDTVLDIPAYINGKAVTEIGYNAFNGNQLLTSVNVPDSVTSINVKAFYCCDNLEAISLPDSVTFIGNSAFEGCRSLKEINIPKYITCINNSTFDFCESLTHITIPESVVEIKPYAFYDCTNLSEVVIPDSVSSIGSGAFELCKKLSEVNLPSRIKTIEDSLFSDCISLRTISIPDSVTKIGDNAFRFCSNLNDISIPEGVLSIGFGAFYSCENLTVVTLPDSLESLEKAAFMYCTKLTKITIPQNVTRILSDAFYKCKNLTIYGFTDSKAQTYAKENNIPFVCLDETDKITVSIPENITVTCVERLIKDGDAVNTGDVLRISADIPDGCRLKSLKVNGTEIENNSTYVVGTENVIITAEFENIQPGRQDAFTLTIPDHVKVVRTETFLNDGDEVNTGDVLRISADIPDGYRLKSLKVNGTDIENDSTYVVGAENVIITAEFEIIQPDVPDEPELKITGIEISRTPDKISYYIGDTLDLTGSVILVRYSDGTSRTIEVSADMTSGFDSSSAGTRTITVTYEGFTSSFVITVRKRSSGVSGGTSGGGTSGGSSVDTGHISQPVMNNKETNWLDITNTIGQMGTGNTIDVDLNGEYEIPSFVLRDLHDRSAVMNARYNDEFTWVIDGSRIAVPESSTALVIRTSGVFIPDAVLNSVPGEAANRFHTNGNSANIELSVSVGEKYSGRFANLYRYSKAPSGLEFVSVAIIDGSGNALVPAGAEGDYVIMVDDYSALPGDLDNNGRTDASDAALILRYIVEQMTMTRIDSADYNRDGIVNALDASAILKDLLN